MAVGGARTRPRLSVNVNRVALLRNSRATGVPSILDFARLALAAGADGVTVHPRPDGRHTKASDVRDLARLVRDFPGRELNVEGRPTPELLDLLEEVRPHQCTLVPDAPDAITSDRGWGFAAEHEALEPIVARLARTGCRVILFSDPSPFGLEWVRRTGADGVEVYTGLYAAASRSGDGRAALRDVTLTGHRAAEFGLLVNGGHDLNRENLKPLLHLCAFAEFSIGHELIADALRDGFVATVASYLALLRAESAAWVA